MSETKEFRWFNPLTALFIALLAGCLVYQCTRDPQVITETYTETKYEVVYDSVLVQVPVDRPIPYAVRVTDTVIDSALAMEYAMRYFDMVYYRDTLMNDSKAFILVEDTVFMGRLMGRTVEYKDRTPTEFVTTTTTTTNIVADRPRFRFYMGPFVSYGSGNAPGLGGCVLLSSKTFAAGYSYDITRQQHYLSMYFSLIPGSRGN